MWWIESNEDRVVNVTRDVLQSVHVVGQADSLKGSRRSGQVC